MRHHWIALAGCIALGAAGPAAAQAVGDGAEDQMLLEGTPPTDGVSRPSEPGIAEPDAGVRIAPLDEALADTPEADGGTSDWVGMTVVDDDGDVLGRVSDVILESGGVSTIVLARADGGVESVPAETLTADGDRLVVDETAAN